MSCTNGNQRRSECSFTRLTELSSIGKSIIIRNPPRLALTFFNPRHARGAGAVFVGGAGGDVVGAGQVGVGDGGQVDLVVCLVCIADSPWCFVEWCADRYRGYCLLGKSKRIAQKRSIPGCQGRCQNSQELDLWVRCARYRHRDFGISGIPQSGLLTQCANR